MGRVSNLNCSYGAKEKLRSIEIEIETHVISFEQTIGDDRWSLITALSIPSKITATKQTDGPPERN